MTPVLSLDGPSRFYGKLLVASGPVLVLGAGDGLVAAALASRGHEVVAVEGSPSLRALVLERRGTLPHPESLVVVSDDPRTLDLQRTFSLVIAPHQAMGLARSPDELHAFLSALARHLEAEGTFAFDTLNEPRSGEVHRPRGVPHLRERTDAIHPLAPLRLSAVTLDEALDSVGLVARERFSDFNETPFSSDAELQVVVGGPA
ncbi:MAG: class I SAM-dependent methyltransferase [Archangium sp.]|nr:class I SAM-dependent methyltransferase [Archangium sp.]MDP3157297.1 class I SAM-dependent methyltransferase [Archangium sp.]MDP3571135.1 class I SAM-dependent methyltransferase [Archangium sp.]